jgi:hypothetical protein
MTLPVAENTLNEFLGDHFPQSVWETGLKQLMEFDGDGDGALKLLADIRSSSNNPLPAQNPSSSSSSPPAQLISLERDLLEQIADL